MTNFGYETLWLNNSYRHNDSAPSIKLDGNKLFKSDIKYFYSKSIVTDLKDGMTLGSNSKESIGKTKIPYLGMEQKLNSLGSFQNVKNEITRKAQVLGEDKREFGKKEIETIGISNSYSAPPTAIIVPHTKPLVNSSSSYWDQTLASDFYKKATTSIKKYFKERY